MALVEIRKRNLVGGKGSSDVATLNAAFPGTPSIASSGQYNDQSVAALMETLHDGVQTGNPDHPNFDLDYGLAPVLADVDVGDAGRPGSPYTPNIVSPGVGSLNPRDMGAPPPGHPRAGSSGAGSTKDTHEASQQVAQQQAGGGVSTGNLIPGSSGATP